MFIQPTTDVIVYTAGLYYVYNAAVERRQSVRRIQALGVKNVRQEGNI